MKQADYIKISGAILRFPRKMCVFGAVNVAVTGHGVNRTYFLQKWGSQMIVWGIEIWYTFIR